MIKNSFLAASLIFSLSLMSVAASVTDTIYFSASIAPATADYNETQTYIFTITNDPGSRHDIKSVLVQIPAGFSILSATGPDDWDFSTSSTPGSFEFELHKISNNDLAPGKSISFTFEAIAPGTYTVAEWTTSAYTGTQLHSSSFGITSSQPIVTVGTEGGGGQAENTPSGGNNSGNNGGNNNEEGNGTGTTTLTFTTPPPGTATTSELVPYTFTVVATGTGSSTYSLDGAPEGAAMDGATGVFTWTPTEEQGPGSYIFNVIASDGNGGTTSESITLAVTEVNISPVALAGTLAVTKNTSATGTLVATDADMPTQPITYATTTNPLHGTISGFDVTTGAYTYVPETDYVGIDSFMFLASDGISQSNEATVSVTISSSTLPALVQNLGNNNNNTNNTNNSNNTNNNTNNTNNTGGGGENGKVGCRDPRATNYDRDAAYDSGNCIYPSLVTTTGSSGTIPQGEVLGVSSTTCTLPFNKQALRIGRKNDPVLVSRLQEFLRDYLKIKLPATGFFGIATETAVRQLQAMYEKEILTPWKIDQPTGIAYITTLNFINNTLCPELRKEVDPKELIPLSD